VRRASYLCIALLLAGLLSACQPQPAPEPKPDLPAGTTWPAYDFKRAAASGLPVYRLDPASSHIDVVVRREGTLARLGHDHVVAARDAQAYLLFGGPIGNWRAEMRFEAAKLDVDPAEERAKYQLDTDPDADAIEGTRRNLLDKVLQAQRWPWLGIEISDFEREGSGFSAHMRFLVRDVASEGRYVFSLEQAGDSVTVTGTVLLRQTDLGLEPFSTLGGALRVADQLEIHLELNGFRPE
jgi:hypothetical protein